MSGILSGVDKRTSLAGANRMELLLFRIRGKQLFGINVFKVREVIRTPEISPVPKSDARIIGIADIRGQTMPIIDLAMSLDFESFDHDNCHDSLTIVTEFNSSVQGFLVEDVDRIVHLRWEDILQPPETLLQINYLTGITKVNKKFVQIVDIEKILTEISGKKPQLSDEFLDKNTLSPQEDGSFILCVDDSSMARNQLKSTLNKLGIKTKIVNNGREALEFLQNLAADAEKDGSPNINKQVIMVISDIEMPEMDGYTLTTNIRKDSRLDNLYVMLSSSLSGGFNDSLTKKVGANMFLSKWNTEALAKAVINRVKAFELEKKL
jgi:two-component system chemotaxis response regulator CheV